MLPLQHQEDSVCLDGYSKRCLLKPVKKGLVLSHKRLTSNHRNFGLPAPKSTGFSSKHRKIEDLSFQLHKFLTSDFSVLTKHS